MKYIMILIMLTLCACSTAPQHENGIDFDVISKEITVTCVRQDGSDCGK